MPDISEKNFETIIESLLLLFGEVFPLRGRCAQHPARVDPANARPPAHRPRAACGERERRGPAGAGKWEVVSPLQL